MECNSAETQFVSYIDGELSGPLLEQLEQHLEECPKCRAALEEMRNFLEVRIPKDSPEPSLDLLPSVRRQIAGPSPRNSWTLRRLSLAAAAALALVAAGWLYHVDFFRGSAAQARSVERVLSLMKDATGWQDIYGVAAELEISQVAAADTVKAALVPLPSPEDTPVEITYKSSGSGEFLQGILDPGNYESVTEGACSGAECWTLHDSTKNLWVSTRTHTPVRVDFGTAVGGWLSIQNIEYSRREGVLVPSGFDVLLWGPGGEQSLRLTLTLKDVEFFQKEG